MSAPKVVLYSTSMRTWEVWQMGRPLCAGSLEACQQAHPDAPPPGRAQRMLAGLPEATPDQSQCDVGLHLSCSGYTEDEFDPETCMCACHNPEEQP
jgi:hypothetical protein